MNVNHHQWHEQSSCENQRNDSKGGGQSVWSQMKFRKRCALKFPLFLQAKRITLNYLKLTSLRPNIPRILGPLCFPPTSEAHWDASALDRSKYLERTNLQLLVEDPKERIWKEVEPKDRYHIQRRIVGRTGHSLCIERSHSSGKPVTMDEPNRGC